MQGLKISLAAVLPLAAACCLALAAAAQNAAAAQVEELYGAEVEVPGGQLDAVFRAALGAVAVKLTGSRSADSPDNLAALGDPAGLVQQYRSTGPGRWRVGFDPVALRARLDAAGLPIWSEERPATVLWLAVDNGRGDREILAAEDVAAADAGLGTMPGTTAALADARELLLGAAESRGLPMLLPLVDSEDLAAVNFAELWGDFSEPVLAASARYRADAVLVGRTQSLDPAGRRVRWTLLFAGERWDWDGTLAEGPEQAADLFAQRLASVAAGRRALRVEVSNIGGLDDYGRVYRYLSTLSSVERCDVERVRGERAWFRLEVRGDADQLLRIIALRRLLVPVDDPTAGADLQFALVGDP